jgi:hypothetical protein
MPPPPLGADERKMVLEVLDYCAERKVDPGYQGAFEKIYTNTFVGMMGGGYIDAVATGTSACYISVAALDLPKGSEVLVSLITDPGTLSARRAQRVEAGPEPTLLLLAFALRALGGARLHDSRSPNMAAISQSAALRCQRGESKCPSWMIGSSPTTSVEGASAWRSIAPLVSPSISFMFSTRRTNHVHAT